jgi:hypothetical protein
MFILRLFVNISLIVILSFKVLFAQDEEQKKEEPKYGWENSFIGTLNLTQTALSNWTQGGEDAWNWQLNLNASFVDKQENYKWANSGKILFGQTRIGSGGIKKTDDEIFIETVYTRKLWNNINPYISATGRTQFTAGYDYTLESKIKISDFFDPAYFRESIGLDYEPSENIKTRFGVSLKQTIADEFAVRYSDDPDTQNEFEKIRKEVGAESVTDIKLNMNKLIVYVTKLELFSTLNRFDEIDVRWDNLFSAKVADYISVSINFILYYDKDISLKRQLKQTMAVGLTYSFL